MIYNDKFVKKYTLVTTARRYSEYRKAEEYSDWGFSNKIRMKLSVVEETITLYFEDDVDMLAFKIKFGL
jgi:hypothetical protein